MTELLHPINAWVLTYLIIIIIVSVYYWYERKDYIKMDKLEDYNDIMMHFHEDPNYDEFLDIYKHREQLIKCIGRPVKYWLWGVYLKFPQFYSDKSKAALGEYLREINRGLRRIKTRPTGELLDCVWSIYFATGDRQYSNIIKDIALYCHDLKIASAATWSYRSIMSEQLLGDSDNEITDDNDIANDHETTDNNETVAAQ